MKYGFINRNVTDLRSRPDFKSERKSQLLFNEPVVITSSRRGYAKVCQPDGYFGWVDEKAIRIIPKSKYQEYFHPAAAFIKSATCNIINVDEKREFPRYLVYGTRLCSVRRQAGYLIVKSLDGSKFYIISKSCLDKKRPLLTNTWLFVKP